MGRQSVMSCLADVRFPPLPQSNIKPFEYRLAEAEAFRGKLSDKQVREIIYSIRGSARDCGELPPEEITTQRDPEIQHIQELVADFFNLTVTDIISHSRKSHLMRPRMIAMYLCRYIIKRSFPKIGRQFCRDHATIIHSVQKITKIINGTYNFSKNYSKINASNDTLSDDIDVLKHMIIDGME